MNKLLLIPSAKPVPLELQVEFGPITPAMIPVRGKPLVDYILRKFHDKHFRAVIATAQEDIGLLDYLALNPDLDAMNIHVGETTTLGETVFKMMNDIKLDGVDFIVLNLADTLIDNDLPDSDFICWAAREDCFRWTTFHIDNSQLSNLKEKGLAQSQGGAEFAFVGVFGIADVKMFKFLLSEALCQNKQSLDPFYIALASYFNKRMLVTNSKLSQLLIEAINWRDFGHLDTYYRSKCAMYSSSRYFNDVKVDINKGTITKTSRDTKKLVNEINWYLDLPPELQHVFPRVLRYSTSTSDAFIEMEFYSYIPLNELFIFADCDLGVWELAFAAIRKILSDFSDHKPPQGMNDNTAESLRLMYEKKTLERLSVLSHDKTLEFFFRDSLVINGRKVMGLPVIFERLPHILAESGVYEHPNFSIIHGDLCFSNILFDRRYGIVRLIDPRGDFGGYNIYGDTRYDLAKLSHSASGFYDLLVNGLFALSIDESANEVELKIRSRSHHLKVRDYFAHWLSKFWAPVANQVALLEPLLFLSMVPLHADNPRCQRAFLAQGLLLLDSYLKNRS